MIRSVRKLVTIVGGMLLAISVMAGHVTAQGAVTSVAVYGPEPADRQPFALVQAAGETWTIDWNKLGGILQFRISAPTLVTIRSLPDCSTVLRFSVAPRSSYTVRFRDSGSATVKRGAGDGGAIGPDQPASSLCAGLPPTDTVTSTDGDVAPAVGAEVWTVILLATFGGLLATWFRLGARRREVRS